MRPRDWIEFQRLLPHQHVADAGLGVGVDDENAPAVVVGQGLGEGEHKRRLANAALGVHDGDGVAHGLLDLVARTTTRSDRQKP